jgi:hypothetical protein
MEPQRASWTNNPNDKGGEPGHTPREPLHAMSRLRKLPHGPFRSLGKHLDYKGWPGCERFMELDRAIRDEAQFGRSHDDRADWDEPKTVDRSKRHEKATEHADDECGEDRTGPSFAEITRGFEELRFRRL